MLRMTRPFNPSKRSLPFVYVTQFLSAFADNVIFFTILAILTKKGIPHPEEYMANVQIAFLLAYVVFAPFVGPFADKHAKANVLLLGNLIKGLGVILLLFNFHPALCYAIVGIGAVVYSPAKYGILPELTHTEDQLLGANARIEGFTILAILGGTVVGGMLADLTAWVGMLVCILLYAASLLLTFWIPRIQGNRQLRYGNPIRDFFKDMRVLLADTSTRFALIGTGAFWMAAAVLRIAFLAWLPIHLGITAKGDQSMIVGLTAVGIVAGSLLTPKLIPVRKFYRSAVYGLLMVAAIWIAAYTGHVAFTIMMLLFIGFFGGVFIIPMNTVLQDIGKHLVGSGKTIAIQNFMENAMMIIGLVVYTLLAALNVPVHLSIVGMAVVLLLFVAYLFIMIPKVRSL